jgi:hypothetical protein
MILGRRFAWAHMGKTAGDATSKLFEVVGDLVLFSHDPADRRKHQTFREFGEEALEKELKVLNVRRLPSWKLSVVHHRSRHGTASDPTSIPIPSADVMVESSEADDMLLSFTDNGLISIDRWLRVESLRQDFIRFVSELRPLTEWEVLTLSTIETKVVAPYERDFTKWFNAKQLRRLYRNNPTWARIEKRIYGSLPVNRWGVRSGH